MGYDARIGFEFLRPGPGFGGSCLPKDCRALISVAEQNGYNFGLLRGVLDVNDAQHRTITSKVDRLVGGLDGKLIGVWGLAFKPNTDDVRYSPSLAVIEDLIARGARIRAYDPAVDAGVGHGRIERATGPMEAIEGADALLLLTEWNEFRWLDFSRVKDTMAEPVVVDARNFLDPHRLRQLGFTYEGVGR
jgi:UDPglucose 6-dehydrogenase